MSRDNISLSEIFQAEQNRKAEKLREQKAIENYQCDLNAIAENGYDRNDPGFIRWEYNKKFGEQIFKNLPPEDLRTEYAKYQDWKKQTFLTNRKNEWRLACEIIDEITLPVSLKIKHGIVAACLYTLPCLKAVIMLPVQLIWGVLLLLAASVSMPFRGRKSKNEKSFHTTGI